MTYPYPQPGLPSQPPPTMAYPAVPVGAPAARPAVQIAPGVREFFARLTVNQWAALGFLVLGAVVLHFAMAFNWQTYTLSMRFGGFGFSNDGPISFGTLLTTDLEKRPIGGVTGMNGGPRPDYTSYSDVLAIVYLILSLGLLGLATAGFLLRGTVQLLLRAAAGAAALLAVACVALIGFDLARLADETEAAMKQSLDDIPGSALGGVEIGFQSSIGTGLVLAIVGCVLLGVAAALSGSGVRRPAPGYPRGPVGMPPGAPQPMPGPPPMPAQAPPPVAPGGAPVVFVEHPTAYQPPTPGPGNPYARPVEPRPEPPAAGPPPEPPPAEPSPEPPAEPQPAEPSPEPQPAAPPAPGDQQPPPGDQQLPAEEQKPSPQQ